MSPGSARMVVLAWCGRVWAVMADLAAGFGCCGTVVVVGAGGGGVVGVPRGSGRGVVRCGLTQALVGVSRPAGGRVGGPPDLSWSSWPGGCRGRVNPLVKRYPEPMAHGPEACGQSHPLWPMARRPASRHTRAEAVDTGYPRSLTREIWNPISNP